LRSNSVPVALGGGHLSASAVLGSVAGYRGLYALTRVSHALYATAALARPDRPCWCCLVSNLVLAMDDPLSSRAFWPLVSVGCFLFSVHLIASLDLCCVICCVTCSCCVLSATGPCGSCGCWLPSPADASQYFSIPLVFGAGAGRSLLAL